MLEGVTDLEAPVPKALSQAKVPVPEAVRLTVAPLSILSSSLVQDVSVAVMLVVGAEITVMVLLAIAVQPLASVIVTL